MSAKYPRTPHLPWSPGGTNTDKRLVDASVLLANELVISEKLDGSNLTMTRHMVFARSHGDLPRHESFALAKSLHSQIRHSIPDGWSVFGEYVFAVHSIQYVGPIPGCFLVFGVRDDTTGMWLAWDEVRWVAQSLGLPMVPELWRGFVPSERALYELTVAFGLAPSAFGGIREGVVVRVAGAIAPADFSLSIAKWVRAGHVAAGSEHWAHRSVVRQPCLR